VRVTDTTTLRAAAFRVLKRNFVASQTLEPTNVAGFNQFFNDINGTTSWRYGVGIDQTVGSDLFFGVEFSRRDSDVPLQFSAINNHVPEINIKELFGRSYVYWTPLNWLALGAEYQYDNIEVHGTISDANTSPVEKIAIHRLPLEARIFLPAGVFARLRGTYVYEQVRLADFETGDWGAYEEQR
jgi:hypothetical protein